MTAGQPQPTILGGFYDFQVEPVKRTTKTDRRVAFTLIEVLIVVVILAVLAAVVISQTDDSTESAKDSTLVHNLHILQSMIGLYQVNHDGQCPTIQGNRLPQLSSATNSAGETGQSGPLHPFGPYVVEVPPNPFDQSAEISAVAVPGVVPEGVSGGAGGWQYDVTTGGIWPNNPEYFQ